MTDSSSNAPVKRETSCSRGGAANLARMPKVSWPTPEGQPLALDGMGIWDPTDGQLLARLDKSHICRGFDPTGQWALVVAPAGELQVLNLKEGGQIAYRCAPLRSRDVAFDPITATMKLAPTGNRLSVLTHGVIRLWDLETNRPILMVDNPGHSSPALSVAEHAPMRRVASGDSQGVIRVWGRTDGRRERTILTEEQPVSALAFAPNGNRLASILGNGSLLLHDFGKSPAGAGAVLCSEAASMIFLSDSELLVGTRDGRLIVIDPSRNEQGGQWRVTESSILSLRGRQGAA